MQTVRRRTWRRRTAITATALLLGLVGAQVPASPLDAAIPLTLTAQPLGEALRALAKQANLQILFDAELVRGLSAVPLTGQMSPRAALGRLLRGTGLEAHEQAPGVIVIRRRAGLRMSRSPATDPSG